ncbi:MAG: putative biopolymer transport ExbB protein [Rickettsiaceae bacterium]|jgi:biopolymer transport protein ExbB|nr:putative biopolymer transport ExbB protein [Rickettsiaceae bacterium]
MTEYGVSNFWTSGDFISHLVALILFVMSVLSWTQIVSKSYRFWKQKKILTALENFWQEITISKAIEKLGKEVGNNNSFFNLASQAVDAAEHFDEEKDHHIEHGLNRGEFITRTLRQSINRSTAKLESGLTMLASIGAIAPFVGLFGTVYGIYHALLGISAQGSATLDKVSGPVGEALIMTAAGLFVAIPSVLAYNAFVRLNRLELMELDGFAHDLYSYLSNGVKASSKKRGE